MPSIQKRKYFHVQTKILTFFETVSHFKEWFFKKIKFSYFSFVLSFIFYKFANDSIFLIRQIDYLDQVAGILICYMMLMHILLWKKIPLENDSLWLEPLKFFMFWFFFKSGMFYKQKTTKDCVIRGPARARINNSP